MTKLDFKVVFWLLVVSFVSGKTQEYWSLALFGGAPYNLKTSLRIHQTSFEDIHLTARYETNPLDDPFYYALRIARWKKNSAWELELLHHKLFLVNNPEMIQHFEVTHGYNLVTLNRAWKRKGIILHLGAGLVIAHAQSTVRWKKFENSRGGIFGSGQYVLAGPIVQFAVEKRFKLWRRLFAALEGKLSAALANVPIQDGDADVPNVAIHGLFGLGYNP